MDEKRLSLAAISAKVQIAIVHVVTDELTCIFTALHRSVSFRFQTFAYFREVQSGLLNEVDCTLVVDGLIQWLVPSFVFASEVFYVSADHFERKLFPHRCDAKVDHQVLASFLRLNVEVDKIVYFLE